MADHDNDSDRAGFCGGGNPVVVCEDFFYCPFFTGRDITDTCFP